MDSDPQLTIAEVERWATWNEAEAHDDWQRIDHRITQMARALLASQAALRAVEFVTHAGEEVGRCPWCYSWDYRGHESDCERRAALLDKEKADNAS